MDRNVVITGMGAVTPIGVGVDKYWESLINGVCGIGEIERIDASDLPVRRAGEVRGFIARDFMSKALTLDLELFAQYAYAAAAEAVENSSLDTASSSVGIVMCSALQGLDVMNRTQTANPKLMTKYMANIAASQFAIKHGITGPSMTISTACSSGGDAVNLASMMIRTGMADAVVVMAGEAAVCPAAILSLSSAHALSPTGQSRPFDAGRDGFVIGEGGGALVLESEEHALSRGAAIHARLLGCGNNTDAYHPVAPRPEGEVAAACIETALKNAGLSPSDVGYVNAHGTATIKGDAAESKAIRRVFGDIRVPVSSTKGATGHMMAAGGITEVIACVRAIQTGVLPPNTGLEAPDSECDLNFVTSENRERKIDSAISIALGFGGQNSCVAVGRY